MYISWDYQIIISKQTTHIWPFILDMAIYPADENLGQRARFYREAIFLFSYISFVQNNPRFLFLFPLIKAIEEPERGSKHRARLQAITRSTLRNLLPLCYIYSTILKSFLDFNQIYYSSKLANFFYDFPETHTHFPQLIQGISPTIRKAFAGSCNNFIHLKSLKDQSCSQLLISQRPRPRAYRNHQLFFFSHFLNHTCLSSKPFASTDPFLSTSFIAIFSSIKPSQTNPNYNLTLRL